LPSQKHPRSVRCRQAADQNANCVTRPVRNSGQRRAGEQRSLIVTEARSSVASILEMETTMLSEHRRRLREIHWLNHAEHYLALVRDAVDKNPQDDDLRELMAAMQAALAKQRKLPLH
jgi:hypothetical protein